MILQFSALFLEEIAEYVYPDLPFISVSKGLELNTLRTMSQIIPQALKNPRQPFIALSGPSFALELMNKLPTGELKINNKSGECSRLSSAYSCFQGTNHVLLLILCFF